MLNSIQGLKYFEILIPIWFWNGKRWLVHSGSGESPCLKWKSSSISFTSEGKMDIEIDKRSGAASAVVQSLHRSIVVKNKFRRKAKLSIYRSIYVPALIYSQELWAVRSWVTLRDGVRS